jgi:hypothetical protein
MARSDRASALRVRTALLTVAWAVTTATGSGGSISLARSSSSMPVMPGISMSVIISTRRRR